MAGTSFALNCAVTTNKEAGMLNVTKGQVRSAVDREVRALLRTVNVVDEADEANVHDAVEAIVDSIVECHIENENSWNGVE